MASATLALPMADANPDRSTPQIASGANSAGLPMIPALDLGQTTGIALRLPDGVAA